MSCAFSEVLFDCRHLKGNLPCEPHKTTGVSCLDGNGKRCSHYDRVSENILIIKLGAVGDVIRTTPILAPLKNAHPSARIFWLTLTPAIVPKIVDVVLPYSLESVEYLRSLDFAWVINLDKEHGACALASSAAAKRKSGFLLKDGIPYPADELAVHKFMTGVFDDLSKQNTKHYMQEIFELCGFEFSGEKFVLDPFPEYHSSWTFKGTKPVIGLNTGCGARWTSRLWPEASWIELAKRLKAKDLDVVFLGGAREHEKNGMLAERTGGYYPGHFPLEKFINLMDQCDLVVTGVTMGMHIAVGLGKRIVLLNNIFNPHEFELYGLGEILQPDNPCKCYFKPTCTNAEYQCMNSLPVERVFDAVFRQL